MWICKNCNEENEDNFDACWNCGAQPDGNPSQNIDDFKKIKNEISINQSKLSEYTSSYSTTRIIAQIVAFLGWIAVITSAVILIIAIIKISQSRYGFQWIGLLPALYVFLTGLFLVMYGQLTRAIVDTSDNTGKMLFLLKKIAGKGSLI